MKAMTIGMAKVSIDENFNRKWRKKAK